MKSELLQCPKCKKKSGFYSAYCGCFVCGHCQQHFHKNQILARCFCGWNMGQGEVLEDDIGEAKFNGEYWEVDY